MAGHENEQYVRQGLAPYLADGEKLHAAIGGLVGPLQVGRLGGSAFCFVGLSTHRLLLLPFRNERPAGSLMNIERANIQGVTLKSTNRSAAQITVMLPNDKLLIRVSGSGAAKWAETWVDTYNKSHRSTSTSPTSEDLTRQISGFESTGMVRSAVLVTQTALRTNPELRSDQAFEQQRVAAMETLLAYRVASAFVLGVCGAIVVNSIRQLLTDPDPSPYFFAGNIAGALLTSFIASMLFSARPGTRNLIMLYAGFGLVSAAISAFSANADIQQIIPGLVLSISLGLLVIGKNSRLRTVIAVVVYVAGYLGPFILKWIST
jgi:hypothetical protein